MSAFTPIADIARRHWHVRLVPIADIAWQPLANACSKAVWRHWSAPLSDEDITAIRMLASERSERSDLDTRQGVNAGRRVNHNGCACERLLSASPPRAQ